MRHQLHEPHSQLDAKAAVIRASSGYFDPNMPDWSAMEGEELWAQIEQFCKDYALHASICGGLQMSCFVRQGFHLDFWLLHKRDSDGKWPPLGNFSCSARDVNDMKRAALKYLWERRHLLPKRKAKELREQAA